MRLVMAGGLRGRPPLMIYDSGDRDACLRLMIAPYVAADHESRVEDEMKWGDPHAASVGRDHHEHPCCREAVGQMAVRMVDHRDSHVVQRLEVACVREYGGQENGRGKVGGRHWVYPVGQIARLVQSDLESAHLCSEQALLEEASKHYAPGGSANHVLMIVQVRVVLTQVVKILFVATQSCQEAVWTEQVPASTAWSRPLMCRE